mmetsp:Transcript_59292/g.125657  ORF Transcript_59292/g.125657 Transcript_59292/m.125657 type:complete len:305 (+) Transcript_59292:94-1008(+)
MSASAIEHQTRIPAGDLLFISVATDERRIVPVFSEARANPRPWPFFIPATSVAKASIFLSISWNFPLSESKNRSSFRSIDSFLASGLTGKHIHRNRGCSSRSEAPVAWLLRLLLSSKLKFISRDSNESYKKQPSCPFFRPFWRSRLKTSAVTNPDFRIANATPQMKDIATKSKGSSFGWSQKRRMTQIVPSMKKTAKGPTNIIAREDFSPSQPVTKCSIGRPQELGQRFIKSVCSIAPQRSCKNKVVDFASMVEYTLLYMPIMRFKIATEKMRVTRQTRPKITLVFLLTPSISANASGSPANTV